MIFKGGRFSILKDTVPPAQNPTMTSQHVKRVAICFYGQTRQGSLHAIPNILRYIGDMRSQCDIFIHTWDEQSFGISNSKRIESNVCPNDVSWHVTQPVTSDSFSTMFNAYEPRVMEVEEYSLQKTKNTWGGRRFDPVTKIWHVSMWRSIQEVNLLKMKYAAKNSLNYTHTVILRSDFVFEPSKSLRTDLNELTNKDMILFGDHMSIWPIYKTKRIEEVIWLGNTEAIDKVAFFSDYYAGTVSNINDPSDPGYRDWQFYAADWIVNVLHFTFLPLANSVMRPYTQIDKDSGIDPLDPGFGNPPSRFGYVRS